MYYYRDIKDPERNATHHLRGILNKIKKKLIFKIKLKFKKNLRFHVAISFILNRDPLGVGGRIHENLSYTNDY